MEATKQQEWACGNPRKLFTSGATGKGVYRVGYTLFAGGMPAEKCIITFTASKPGKALNEIYLSGRHPVEFHGHEFA